jgi:hypothetical protein
MDVFILEGNDIYCIWSVALAFFSTELYLLLLLLLFPNIRMLSHFQTICYFAVCYDTTLQSRDETSIHCRIAVSLRQD